MVGKKGEMKTILYKLYPIETTIISGAKLDILVIWKMAIMGP